MPIAMAIHGGASAASTYLNQHIPEIEEGLKEAIISGYDILRKGGSALDAVEKAVIYLEDNPHFNAGRGSALNCQGIVEMDASIMNGKDLKAGAISMVRLVKNPIHLARLVMEKTNHVFISGYGALELAKLEKLPLEDESYFMTEHQYNEFQKYRQIETYEDMLQKPIEGTVGAVALDKQGNLAAATSTGGTSNCLPGRIGDSCVIGAGCYANNLSCAVSGTGEGEYLITGVIAHTISMMVEQNIDIEEACHQVLHIRNKGTGEIGVISVDKFGKIGMAFNTEIMKRAWIDIHGKLNIKVFS